MELTIVCRIEEDDAGTIRVRMSNRVIRMNKGYEGKSGVGLIDIIYR